ncbi:MAG: beta-aspartyl-peptidase [Deltaproteobacteria bacterium]|nr:beta-aspartyl-peptidase [Deltaproteobacteria bacterium]
MYAIAIHGGAGLSTPEDLGAERERTARIDLEKSLLAAERVLQEGGSAEEAVIAAVMVMEDSPMFNAGKGAVFASDGVQRMDASIMTGHDEDAGALCGVSIVKNPIRLASAIMHNTPHVMLYGDDAHEHAKEAGLEIVESSWFHTQYRLNQLKKAKKANKILLDHEHVDKGKSKGTVGAVALDIHGNIAAATSTGGLVNKRPGRVGDSALIGAGTYAKNSTCAVSATGHGELFIRANIAGRMSALMELGGKSLHDAAHQIVWEELEEDVGGLIAIDQQGNITMPFNTGGMFRGSLKKDEKPKVWVWKEENK